VRRQRRPGEHFLVIVPGSGTGALSGITGSGGIDDGHRIWFDYEVSG